MVNRHHKAELAAQCLTVLAAATFGFMLKRSHKQQRALQTQLDSLANNVQTRLDSMSEQFQPVLDARRRATRIMTSAVNTLGVIGSLGAVGSLVLIVLGIGASSPSPQGLAGAFLHNPSLIPAIMGTAGAWLTALMVRISARRSSSSSTAKGWANSGTLVVIACAAAATWLSYWCGATFARWYGRHYEATGRAFIAADNAVQSFVITLTFSALMAWLLFRPLRKKQDSRFWRIVVLLAGILPLLAVLEIFQIPSLRAGGMRWMPMLFSMTGTFVVVLIEDYARRWKIELERSQTEIDRSWAVRTFWTTFVLNVLGIYAAYWYAAHSALGNGHKQVSATVLYLDNMV